SLKNGSVSYTCGTFCCNRLHAKEAKTINQSNMKLNLITSFFLISMACYSYMAHASGLDPDRLFETAAVQKLIDVTGRVNDTDGNPIGGVTVSVKGGTKVTSTDNAGQYALRDIEENDILVFMYMGKQSQEVSISART